MLTIEEIVNKIKDKPISDIARDTGLAYNTIKNLKSGQRGAHSGTIDRLSKYLRGEPLDNEKAI